VSDATEPPKVEEFFGPRFDPDDTPERRVEVRRVADAMRGVIDRFVATLAPIEVFQGVADDLEAIAARLAEHPQGHLFIGFAEAANRGDSDGPFDNSPLMGLSNPLAPPLHLTIEPDRVVGTSRFGTAYEGPPGCVHGGYIAAAFDEVLGLVQSLSGKPGMTGRLTIHYRSPTPLHEELRWEAKIDRVQGRKIICSGQVFAGDRLCAEAEGLFISVDFERLKAMVQERDAGLP
jgi:acyl-coenzyme A thioesterase PaaI-like protein